MMASTKLFQRIFLVILVLNVTLTIARPQFGGLLSDNGRGILSKIVSKFDSLVKLKFLRPYNSRSTSSEPDSETTKLCSTYTLGMESEDLSKVLVTVGEILIVLGKSRLVKPDDIADYID